MACMRALHTHCRVPAVYYTRCLKRQRKCKRLQWACYVRTRLLTKCNHLYSLNEPDDFNAEPHASATVGALAREISGTAELAGGRTAQYSQYMPHMSLLYSDIDACTRDVVVAQTVARLYGDSAK